MKHLNAITTISVILIVNFTILAINTNDIIYRSLFSSLLFMTLISLIKVNSTSNSTNKTNE
jgi:hypothetical protein